MQIDGLDAKDLKIFIAEFLARFPSPFPALSPTLTSFRRRRRRDRWVSGAGGKGGLVSFLALCSSCVCVADDVSAFGEGQRNVDNWAKSVSERERERERLFRSEDIKKAQERIPP